MDTELQKKINEVVKEIYEDVKLNRNASGMATVSAEGAAKAALEHMAMKLVEGTGFQDDLGRGAKDVPKRFALQYLELLLTSLKEKDPTPNTRMWQPRG
jgi:hypothetical protein